MAILSFDIFWRDHGANEGSRRLGENANRSAHQIDAMKASVAVGAAVAGAALYKMGKDSIAVASDISESQSKVKVVFGASAKSILDFGETSATSLGISKKSALEAAGTFGNLFVSLKLPQAEAAKMSTKMITLAADMASFNNASPEEALDAIRSGLVGETEPLRRFGVNMNDATLRTQALSMGLIKNVKEALTPAVKAQAAYGLMLAQTGTAQGDFGRTSNGLANQQRILAARFEDLQGKLGEKLLPIVNKLMDGMLGLLTVFSNNQKTITPLAVSFVVLAVSIWGVNKAALGATKSMAAWNIIMGLVLGQNRSALTSYLALQKGILLVAGSAAIVGTAFASVWANEKLRQWDTANVSVERLAKGMKEVENHGRLSGAEIELFQGKLQVFGDKVDTSKEALEKFGWQAHDALDQGWSARIARWDDMGKGQKSFTERTKALDDTFANLIQHGNIDEAQKQFKLYADAAEKAHLPVSELQTLFPKYSAAVADANEKTKAHALAIGDLADVVAEGATAGLLLSSATAAQTRAMIKNTDVVELSTEQLLEHANAVLKNRGSENSFEASLDDATKALKDNGKTLDKHTEKGRTNRQALDQIASSTLQWRDAAKLAGKSQAQQTAITEQGREALVRMGKRFGMSKKDAEAYAKEVLGIPKRVASTITLSLDNNIPKTLFGIRVGGYGKGLGVLKAEGGGIHGPGHGTSDSIPAMLSNGEHVWTAREVHAAGGHRAVEGMRRSVLGYATGGGVFGGDKLTQGLMTIAAGTTGRLAKRIEQIAAMAIGYNPSLNGALAFARRQVGKPYIWGAVGPGGYDCSGFMSALLNVVQGRSPYQRRFSTGTFPSAGFVPGPGSFMIGSRRGTPGHMAGTINGVNVESSGSVGPHMGSGARGARNSMFTGLYHLKGYAAGGPAGDAPYEYLNPNGEKFLGYGIRKALLMDGGGVLGHGQAAINMSGHPERMLSPSTTRSFDRLVRVLDSNSGTGGPIVIHINAVGSDIELENKLVRVISNARAHGRIK